MFSGELEDIR